MATFNIKNSKVKQISDSGTNVLSDQVKIAAKERERGAIFATRFGVIGTVATLVALLVSLYQCHRAYGWWFFGLQSDAQSESNSN